MLSIWANITSNNVIHFCMITVFEIKNVNWKGRWSGKEKSSIINFFWMPDLDKNSFEVATRFLLLVSLALLPLLYDYFLSFCFRHLQTEFIPWKLFYTKVTVHFIIHTKFIRCITPIMQYGYTKVENYEIDLQSS